MSRTDDGDAGPLGQAAPLVSASESFGAALAWSEERAERREKTEEFGATQGLGELRAKKPGQDRELASAVTLASHKTTIRVETESAGALGVTDSAFGGPGLCASCHESSSAEYVAR